MADTPPLPQIDVLAAALPDAQSPCGRNLEYDPDFIALFVAAEGKPERQSGESLVPAEEPDWQDVRQRAESLLVRTKDIRLSVLLTRALVRTAGLAGLAGGLELTRELLSRHWDQVYPQLDAEDHDPTMRLNALAPLADADAVLGDLRAAALLPSGHPRRLSVRDILGQAGKLPPAEGAPTEVEMASVLTKAAAEGDVPITAIQAALEAALDIRSLLVEKVGSEQATDLSPLTEALKVLAHWLGRILGTESAAAAGDDNEATPAAGTAEAGSGDIRSREDVVRLLERTCAFLERTEPTNPAPLFIRRAQQLLTKHFIDIVEDLAPESLGPIKKMVGLDRE